MVVFQAKFHHGQVSARLLVDLDHKEKKVFSTPLKQDVLNIYKKPSIIHSLSCSKSWGK